MIAPRRLALALIALAVLVHVALTSRWSADEAAFLAQSRRLLSEQKTLTRQLGPLERRAELRLRASALVGRSASAAPDPQAVHDVRTGIVKALGQAGRYRLDVREGNAGGLATVSLTTEGAFFAMVDLVSTLARPGSGLVLQHISFSPSFSRVALEVEAVALGDTP